MSDSLFEAPGPSALRVGTALAGVVLGAVVVFALGVMVGKRVTESAPVIASPPAALPTEDLPPRPGAPAIPSPPEKLTFYDRLSGAAPAIPTALLEEQPPPQTLAAPARQPDAPAALRETPMRQPEDRAAPPARAPDPAKTAAKADPVAQIRKLSGKGRYAVQVASVNNRAAAGDAVARIKRQGFEAVTVMASVKGKIWYRVRVGSFPNQRAAAQAAEIIRSAYGFNAITVQE